MPGNSIHFESLLLVIIVQLIAILACARAAGALFRRVGQPAVVGEIAAGLILGPSVFGSLLPHIQHLLFNPAAGEQIRILSQIGLVFIMFLIGLEFDFSHLAGSTRITLSIAGVGMILPFSLGIVLARWIHSQMSLQVEGRAFALFIATALSITAMPVLAFIMIEFNLTKTRLGAIIMAAAALEDAVGWLLLAMVAAVAGSQFHPERMLLATTGTVAYLLAMVFAVRPLLLEWVRCVMRDSDGELSLNGLAQLIVLLLISAAVTSWIGIFSTFGAFVMGSILHGQKELRTAVERRIRDFVTAFFLPIFFTYTGLRTDIGSMRGARVWLICAIVVLVASTGKFGGCSVAAKLNGLTWREAAAVGIMMNTRGLMELIVLNTGFDLGIIPKPVFSIMVIMAVATTCTTAPTLRRLIRGMDIQSCYETSSFAQYRPVGSVR